MGGEGEFAILSATPNATNQNTWIKWMQEELKKPEYAKMKLVKIAYGNDDDQKSFVETQGFAAGVSEPEGDRRTDVGRHCCGGALYLVVVEQGEGGGDRTRHA